MQGEAVRPDKPPRFCGKCQDKSLVSWHCPNPQCLWVKCEQCKGVTSVAHLLGKDGA